MERNCFLFRFLTRTARPDFYNQARALFCPANFENKGALFHVVFA